MMHLKNIMKKLELNFFDEVESGLKAPFFEEIFERFSEVLAERIEAMVPTQNGEVNLALINDEKIHLINRDFRGFDKPTDVISCAYLEGEEMPLMEEMVVGDMYISIETAKRQAEEKGHDLETEVKMLFVHGLLHIFGFDHNTDEEEAEMEGWAGKVLAC